MISDARGGHVSPGVYTEEKIATISAKSLGLTSLGLVGETVKGPAFQPVDIKDWTEFVDYFGGTSPEKYIGTDVPKYELPYIAKEYLKESNNLHVVRVLGLSGYWAGKAFVIKANDSPLIVLRSKKYIVESGETGCDSGDYDVWTDYVTSVSVTDYDSKDYESTCAEITTGNSESIKYVWVEESAVNGEKVYALKGKFKIEVTWTGGTEEYNVSMDENDPDYIYNVIGHDPIKGGNKIYIESVFDKSFVNSMVLSGTVGSSHTFTADVATLETDVVLDYIEPFRPAMTPWIVSQVRSNTDAGINLSRLFRFISISDGNAANYQVKVSIQRIKPDAGTFDVLVRDFYDTDFAPIVLEKFANCTMVEGEDSFIGYKIGTADGAYEAKSKFVVVEMANGNETVENCVPAGFMGYPVPRYVSNQIDMSYNTVYNNSIKPKRQYFGLNEKVIDEDVLSYKGRQAYFETENGFVVGNFEGGVGVTNGFHLDSIMNKEINNSYPTVFVDSVSAYTSGSSSEQIKFDTVSPYNNGSYEYIPRIVTEDKMVNMLYEDLNTRKFTVYLYGGFDGWNIYNETRTNTNEYRANRYAAALDYADIYTHLYKKVTGITSTDTLTGYDPTTIVVDDLNQGLDLKLPATAITTDYYAYLAGYKQFANPNDIDINIFATPGIDWVHNSQLVEDADDVVEDPDDGRGGDAIYIVTTPMTDEYGAEWTRMTDITSALDDSEIDSSYMATFYPWAKYFDDAFKMYIEMPTTRDVVRNMAYTDNKLYPWFTPAGMSRGNVDCIRASKRLTLLEEDDLYEDRINPIKSFKKSEGVKLWGNKTLYSGDNPIGRINVRRLMIRVKQLVVDASKSLIFEPYDVSLEKQFRSIVEPILADVKSKRGIVDYRVITEVTKETIDQHILPAKILVKPLGALEYVSITFTVYPETVDFNE